MLVMQRKTKTLTESHTYRRRYADKHEARHRPEINSGIVVKTNANQKYATTAVTSFMISELARRHSIPTQQFVVRNDSTCGSTIGNLVAANTGVRTVDVGAPQVVMIPLTCVRCPTVTLCCCVVCA